MQQRTDSSDQRRTVLRQRKIRKIGLGAQGQHQIAEKSYVRPPHIRKRSTQSRNDSQVRLSVIVSPLSEISKKRVWNSSIPKFNSLCEFRQ